MKKKILIGLGCLLLVPLVVISALFAIREPPDGPRVDAAVGIVGIEAGGSYAWILRTAHGAVLVDAGLDSTGTAILKELKAEGVEATGVKAVLLTHGHPDHYAAARLFTDAAILVGSADIAMIHGDKTHYGTFAKIMGAVMPLPPAPSSIRGLRGGEDLTFDGAAFRVIATPGHSPGSVMYLYKDVLFTGDSLLRKGDGVGVPPSLFSENSAQNRESVRALLSVTFDTIADGHVGATHSAKAKLSRLLAGS